MKLPETSWMRQN